MDNQSFYIGILSGIVLLEWMKQIRNWIEHIRGTLFGLTHTKRTAGRGSGAQKKGMAGRGSGVKSGLPNALGWISRHKRKTMTKAHNARLDEVPVHCGSHTQNKPVSGSRCWLVFLALVKEGSKHGFCERTCAC